jgi:hypothetical protein
MSAEFDDVLTNQPVVIDNVCQTSMGRFPKLMSISRALGL